MRLAVTIILLLASSVAFSFHAGPIVRSRSSGCRYGTNSRHMTRVMCSSDQLPTLPPPPADDDGRDGNESDSQQSEGISEAVIGNIMGAKRKITIVFTCKICEDRSSYQMNRVAYEEGIVVLWCKGCGQKHLIADNLGKLDFPEFGRNLEEYMAKRGTPVRRVTMSKDGIGSFEPQLPGVHFPASEGSGARGYDAKSILPGDNVGDSILPGIPPAIFDFGKEQAAGASDSVSRGGRAGDESTSQDSD